MGATRTGRRARPPGSPCHPPSPPPPPASPHATSRPPVRPTELPTPGENTDCLQTLIPSTGTTDHIPPPSDTASLQVTITTDVSQRITGSITGKGRTYL